LGDAGGFTWGWGRLDGANSFPLLGFVLFLVFVFLVTGKRWKSDSGNKQSSRSGKVFRFHMSQSVST